MTRGPPTRCPPTCSSSYNTSKVSPSCNREKSTVQAYTFATYDSMRPRNNEDHIHRIIRFLQAHPHLKDRKWHIGPTGTFLQQGNGYDCGLFACAAALCIMTKQIMNFSQAHMENFRLQLAHILIKDSTLLGHTTALNKEGEREKRGRQEAEANQTSSSTTTTPETNIPKNTHITDSSPKPATRQTRKTKRKRHTGPKTGQKKDTPIEQPAKPPQINKRKIQQTKKQTVQSSIKN